MIPPSFHMHLLCAMSVQAPITQHDIHAVCPGIIHSDMCERSDVMILNRDADLASIIDRVKKVRQSRGSPR